ncbi:sulfatase-like hydrolase/transferase [Horticoccus luteus]|uniref:Sulfatase-like hydrolase/transferase n=1 Tax=Horticoccus luteus TaxID=2862869 RepID=A0A8F9TYF0_9BACT|nr:sulfatase-like hydrolase/transferase [Horticoccus luteus]QYM80043.1 sulfatase-like hydrolase/transferase [Horticoccus luteus]
MSHSSRSIVWIVTTQWRGQALGCAGDVNARTPGLDAMAAGGVNFCEAVTPHPFGPFARAAMLTGVLSPANGVRDYFDPLPGGARTAAHVFGEAGYGTGFFGKWHLSERDRTAPLVGEAHARSVVPAARRGGFAFWEGFESGFQLNNPWLHGSVLPEPTQFRGYQAEVVCARAAEWCAAQTVPFFAMVSLEPPHPPYGAAAAGVARRAPEAMVLAPNVPRGGEVERRARAELAGYYAHIEATDRAVAALAARLDAAGSIVVVTSVHGDMHGAHGLFRKGWPYEESIRVPMIVTGIKGGRAAGGRRDEALVSLTDLLAWSLGWAGVGPCAAPAEAQLISMPSVVALPDQCDRVWRGLRTRSHKIVLNDDGAPWLCFDRSADPFEQINLVGAPGVGSMVDALAREARWRWAQVRG